MKIHAGIIEPGGVISSVRVEEGHSHDKIFVWNHGGLAGHLTVNRGDGLLIAKLLGATEMRIEEMNK